MFGGGYKWIPPDEDVAAAEVPGVPSAATPRSRGRPRLRLADGWLDLDRGAVERGPASHALSAHEVRLLQVLVDAVRIGDHDAAQRYSEEALRCVASRKLAVLRAAVVAEIAEVQAHLGRFDEARALVEEGEAWRARFGAGERAPWVRRIAVAKGLLR